MREPERRLHRDWVGVLLDDLRGDWESDLLHDCGNLFDGDLEDLSQGLLRKYSQTGLQHGLRGGLCGDFRGA